MNGRVLLVRDGPVARVTIDRPEALNAMTFGMYAELDDICRELTTDRTLRAVVVRGAGGRAFVAGSDITQFKSFKGAEDGLAYEAEMDRHFAALEAIPVPVVAVIDGFAVGAGWRWRPAAISAWPPKAPIGRSHRANRRQLPLDEGPMPGSSRGLACPVRSAC